MTVIASICSTSAVHQRPLSIYIDTDPPAASPADDPRSAAACSPPDYPPHSAVSLKSASNELIQRMKLTQSFIQVSTVSSFNYPARTDTTLLTPASSSSSPNLQRKDFDRGVSHLQPRQYVAPQEVTPPATNSRWFAPIDFATTSQTSSPITLSVESSEASFDMSYLPPSHSPRHSVDDNIPPPHDPYTGHYGVSGGSPPDEPHPFTHYGYASSTQPVLHVDPGLLGRVSQSPTVPMAPIPFGTHLLSSGMATPDSSVAPYTRMPPLSAHSGRNSTRSLAPGFIQPSIANGVNGNAKIHKTKRSRPKSRSRARTASIAPPPQSLEPDTEQLTLQDDCPPEDRELFQLRLKHQGAKGQMWQAISAEYAENHGELKTPALQMKVSRAVMRYGIWPTREVSILARLEIARRALPGAYHAV
jgi:hypothetical protein